MPRKLLYKWDNLPATLVCPCATRTLFLPRAGLEGAGRWDPFVKQTVEQQNEQIKQYIKSFYVWLFSLNQNRSFLPDSEWLNSPDSNNNHPSGCLTPSKQDLMLTKKIVKLAGMMKVHVLDHIIVCNNDFYSFSREGLMEEEMEEFYNQW